MVEVVKTALMITAFVSVMMLLVEYLNVSTAGAWQTRLTQRRWGQYLLAALLGATPGCLGAFAVVTMYSHGALTLGAVIAAMIATSGDEAFVMFALFPGQAAAVTGILFVIGFAAGILVDTVAGNRLTASPANCLELHPSFESYGRGRILHQWVECTPTRGTLAIAILLFAAAILTGQLGPPDWNWIRWSLGAVSVAALWVVSTVSDHFLEEHLWRHVVRRHVPRIFLWTLGALIVTHVITDLLRVQGMIHEGRWALLLVACLVGLIPASGPHLVFVAMYAQGVVPFSILLASSIVQDGHGMLPLLAHSRREFLLVKAINFCAGLAFGSAALAIGV
jgi:hypothetical protein